MLGCTVYQGVCSLVLDIGIIINTVHSTKSQCILILAKICFICIELSKGVGTAELAYLDGVPCLGHVPKLEHLGLPGAARQAVKSKLVLRNGWPWPIRTRTLGNFL